MLTLGVSTFTNIILHYIHQILKYQFGWKFTNLLPKQLLKKVFKYGSVISLFSRMTHAVPQLMKCHLLMKKSDVCWPGLVSCRPAISECRCLETSKFRVQLPYGPAILSAKALQASNTKCRCPTDQQSQNAVACRTAMSAVAPQASNTQASGVQLPCRPAIHYHRQSAVALQASNTHRMCCLFPCVASPLA